MRYLILVLLIVSFSGFAEIYKWTDANGRVHYGDSPEDKNKAERVVVKVNSYEGVAVDNIEGLQEPKPASKAESKHVIMYATSWCGYCKKARNYFKEAGISFTEYDIEKNARAKQRYDRLGGKGVPLILVGNKRMSGFSVSGFESMYK